MGEKHRDCTDEWDKQQQALKKMTAEAIPANKDKNHKKNNQ